MHYSASTSDFIEIAIIVLSSEVHNKKVSYHYHKQIMQQHLSRSSGISICSGVTKIIALLRLHP